MPERAADLMSILRPAFEAGVVFNVEGNRVFLTATGEPSREVVEQLVLHVDEIVSTLMVAKNDCRTVH